MMAAAEPGPNTNVSKMLSAATEIEDMISELQEVLIKIRANPRAIDDGYTLVYNWRTKFGRRVVCKLGRGLPRNRIVYARGDRAYQ